MYWDSASHTGVGYQDPCDDFDGNFDSHSYGILISRASHPSSAYTPTGFNHEVCHTLPYGHNELERNISNPNNMMHGINSEQATLFASNYCKTY